jgi:hypothetical protein
MVIEIRDVTTLNTAERPAGGDQALFLPGGEGAIALTSNLLGAGA